MEGISNNNNRLISLAIFCFAFGALMVPKLTLAANESQFDDVWEMRAVEAKLAVLQAYEPNPYNVTDTLNAHVHRALLEAGPVNATSTTRRQLRGRGYRGPCIASNPIDRCWRCNPNWHLNRKRLADCGVGFGAKAIGGKAGRFYVVYDNSDNDLVNPKPGTLRHAVIQKEPLWIIFKKSMTIRLKGELIIQSHKTIDGRGVRVHIAYGAGLMLQFVQNVIIHNLRIHDIVATNGGMIRDSVDHYGFRGFSEGDGITVFGSANIWIDHVSMWRCKDGLIDVVAASTAVTISNGHFTDHNDVMLFGAQDFNQEDKKMQVTVAFNHFGKRLIQRMPRCRWGFVHIVNNDYTHWLMYAIGGSSSPTIISQGNRFIAPPNLAAKEVTKRDYATPAEWSRWTWRSEGDVMMNGAFFVQSGNPNGARALGTRDMLVAQNGMAVPALTRFSGSLNCRAGKPC